MPITNIQVSKCDNELYILAASTNGGPSTELLHITSGYNQPVSYSINPGAVLQKGNYNLYIVGINWGAQLNFSITLTSAGGTQTNTYTTLQPTAGPAVWVPASTPVQISVVAP